MAGGKYKPKRGGGKNFTQRSRAAVDDDAIGSWDMRDPAADRAKEEDDSSDDSDGFGGKKSKSDEESSEESSSESEEEEGEEKTNRKVKSEPVIQTENPNRQQKVAVKASSLSQQKPQELSRRDREAAEKEAAKARYWALHQAGKTDEAKSDLARLAIIRQKREDAKLQREAEAAVKSQTAEEKLQGRKRG